MTQVTLVHVINTATIICKNNICLVQVVWTEMRLNIKLLNFKTVLHLWNKINTTKTSRTYFHS